MYMSILDDRYCQLCENLITKEEWNELFHSSSHLHREVNGSWPAYFAHRKLLRDENIILEKAFWKKFFATRDIKEVEELV